MPEALKHIFNTELIAAMARHLQRVSSDFKSALFIGEASQDLENLELKERSYQIAQALHTALPCSFSKAAACLQMSLGTELPGDGFTGEIDEAGIAGWAIMPLAHFVACYGGDDFDLSMGLLKECTKRFTSEFALRFFIQAEPIKTMVVLHEWAQDSNMHVRRLASEGSRPRLPWAMQLPLFIADPSPVLALLEQLKDDSSEYVRRSVANNLNDIAKDHPDKVSDITRTWLQGASPERVKLLRHACRTLLKKGHSPTMLLFGYAEAHIGSLNVDLSSDVVLFGTALCFSISFVSTAKQKQNLLIDYVIHHIKANGKTTPKVFKWSCKSTASGEKVVLHKKHMFKKISTRRYYAGEHYLEVMMNGKSVARTRFIVKMS